MAHPYGRRFFLGVALLVATATVARAQHGRLVGHVRDSAGTPIVAAQVSSSAHRTLTDTAGRFSFDGLPVGSVLIRFRRLGYEPRDSTMLLVADRHDSMRVVLIALPIELEGVSSEAARLVLVDFYRHKSTGTGRYFDREQIEAFNVRETSDILRRIPGVQLRPDASGRLVLRMGRSSGNCPPDFWIDGVRAPFLNVDDIPLNDIEALEVYNGPAGLPPEFLNRFGNPACGAVVIWTRLPG
jgi:hypothetical protein